MNVARATMKGRDDWIIFRIAVKMWSFLFIVVGYFSHLTSLSIHISLYHCFLYIVGCILTG